VCYDYANGLVINATKASITPDLRKKADLHRERELLITYNNVLVAPSNAQHESSGSVGIKMYKKYSEIGR
jgi:hypothetical protein